MRLLLVWRMRPHGTADESPLRVTHGALARGLVHFDALVADEGVEWVTLLDVEQMRVLAAADRNGEWRCRELVS